MLGNYRYSLHTSQNVVKDIATSNTCTLAFKKVSFQTGWANVTRQQFLSVLLLGGHWAMAMACYRLD